MKKYIDVPQYTTLKNIQKNSFTFSATQYKKFNIKNNNKLKVKDLSDYVTQVVPKITQEKFHYSQTPQIKLNKNFILRGEN